MQNLLPSGTSVLQFGQPCRTSPSGTDKCIAETIGVAVKFGLKAFRLGRPHRLSPKVAAHRTRAADRQLKCREARLLDDFRMREFGYNCNRIDSRKGCRDSPNPACWMPRALGRR
jgi:hypothetical protein